MLKEFHLSCDISWFQVRFPNFKKEKAKILYETVKVGSNSKDGSSG